MKTPVHFNSDRSLVVLPNYIQRRFGTWRTPDVGGACLLMQLSSLYNTQLQVPHRTIQRALLNFLSEREKVPFSGLPFVDTLEAFDHLSPWKLTGLKKHDTETVESALVSGSPVLLVSDSKMFGYSEDANGWARLNLYKRRLSMSSRYKHALLVVGYDYQCRLLIARESRDHYTKFQGLMKIRVDDLDRWKSGWQMFEPVFERR